MATESYNTDSYKAEFAKCTNSMQVLTLMKILSDRMGANNVKMPFADANARVKSRERFMLVHDKVVNDEVLSGHVCPYCGNATELTDSIVIYGTSYGMIWLCRPCDAYAGTHKSDNKTSLGRLANRELRYWKKEAHASFDPMWKEGGMKRNDAYSWLSKQLGIDRDKTHIGMFNVMQCRSVIEVCTRQRYKHI